MYDLKKWKLKQNKYGFKGSSQRVVKSTVKQSEVNQMKKSIKKSEGASELDKTPIKRKTTMNLDKGIGSDIK